MRLIIIKFVFLILIFSLFSCSARINGSINANGSAVLSVNMSLEPGISALIQRLSNAGGQAGIILDAPSITRGMSEAPGISSASFRNISPSSMEGQVNISRIDDFLASAGSERNTQNTFIVFEQGQRGGRCVININRNNGPEILDLLSPEISDYLNALMAPIATGEEMTKREYLELVTSFYNRVISDEISSSRIRAAIDFPGTISNIRGGTFSGRRASFDIPLLDLLVLETPLIYEVTWN